jgi:hypothetical protein
VVVTAAAAARVDLEQQPHLALVLHLQLQLVQAARELLVIPRSHTLIEVAIQYLVLSHQLAAVVVMVLVETQ